MESGLYGLELKTITRFGGVKWSIHRFRGLFVAITNDHKQIMYMTLEKVTANCCQSMDLAFNVWINLSRPTDS